MLVEIGFILAGLIIVVLAAELFTNGIEWLGQRLQLSEGVVGSVLAAVGTALPETLIPFVAIMFFGAKNGESVGIGAIAGAPFMLSTLTLGLCGLTVLLCSKGGSRPRELQLNQVVIARDLRYFTCAYTLAMLAVLASPYVYVRYVVATVLFLIYPIYVWKCFQHEGEIGEAPEHLFLDRLFKCGSDKLRLIIPQIFLGLAGIIGGAFLFVDHVDDLACYLGLPTIVLSLIITPVATELPEKINSVLWARQGKDTLALGNITGALVFQSCIPVAFGVGFTKWNLDPGTVLTGIVAVISGTIFMLLLKSNKLKAVHLTCGMVAYAIAIGSFILLDYLDGGLEYLKPGQTAPAAHRGSSEAVPHEHHGAPAQVAPAPAEKAPAENAPADEVHASEPAQQKEATQ